MLHFCRMFSSSSNDEQHLSIAKIIRLRMKPNIQVVQVNAFFIIDHKSSTYRNTEFVAKTDQPMDAVSLLVRVCSLVELSCCKPIQIIHNNMNNERILD